MNGLQAERTVLAWSRTVLAIAATGALIARVADSGIERALAGPLAALGVVLAVVTSTWRRRAIVGDHVTASSPWIVAGLLAGLGALLVAALLVIL
jgi:uncharacterized membrane protein YidH (DUF202 family)